MCQFAGKALQFCKTIELQCDESRSRRAVDAHQNEKAALREKRGLRGGFQV
jgi:hypothetical protein